MKNLLILNSYVASVIKISKIQNICNEDSWYIILKEKVFLSIFFFFRIAFRWIPGSNLLIASFKIQKSGQWKLKRKKNRSNELD